MRNKLFIFPAVVLLLAGQALFAFAQVPAMSTDTASPAMDSTIDPVTEPVTAPDADTKPPVFTAIAAVSVEETQVSIAWTTDEFAFGYVEYGETASYGQKTLKSAQAGLGHTQSLTNLKPGTIYYYRVVAEDEGGNVSYSENRSLETAAEVVIADNVPPEISEIDVSLISTTGATISWITDELAQGKVEYGLTESYGSATALASDYDMEHSAALSNLESGKIYHYKVMAQDEAGNIAFSPDEIFTTNEIPPETSVNTATTSPATPTETPATPFAISQVETVSVSTSTATIAWTTNESANAQVLYGVDENYASATPVTATLNTSHQLTLSGLKSGTNYFYKVVSKNASGNTAMESGLEFNTLYKNVIVDPPPIISRVSIESAATSSAIIKWNTDTVTKSKIEYGPTAAYEEGSWSSEALNILHAAILANLKPNTFYNFRIVSRNGAGNSALSKNYSFTTSALAVLENIKEPVVLPKTPETLPESLETLPSVKNKPGVLIVATPPTKPIMVKAEALDKQVIFVWFRNLKKDSKIKIRIVRNSKSKPVSNVDGEIIYDGAGKSFTDTNLENGKKYYYWLYRYDNHGRFSPPVRISATPVADKDQVTAKAVLAFAQIAPKYSFSKNLLLKDNSQDVRHLQILLKQYPKLYPEGLITGYFGSLTRQAITNLQLQYGLLATGYADEKTRKKLEELSRAPHVLKPHAVIASSFSREFSLGFSGDDVAALQQFLVDQGHYPEALVTGYFGQLTKAALIRFQKNNAIQPASGYFDFVTKNKVLELLK